jgi:MFS family permease
MLGILSSSIIGGRVISKLGRYKWFMVVGAVTTTAGLLLHVLLQVDTPLWEAGLFMFVIGVGLGLVMQPLVLAAQNGLSLREMGTGTSTSTFVRTLGASAGVAVFGAVFNNRLAHWLSELAPASAGGAPSVGADTLGDPKAILALPPQVVDLIQESFVRSIHTVFLAAAGAAVLAIVITLVMPNAELRGGDDTPKPADEAEAKSVLV